MTDPLTWSIKMGRWGGTRVQAHVLLLLFAAVKLLESAWIKEKDRPHPTLETIGWLLLLLLALAARQITQAFMAARLEVERDDVRLWPLGQLVSPVLSRGERSPEAALVVASGLMTSLGLALGTAIGLGVAGVAMVFNPFGTVGFGGTPRIDGHPVSPFMPVWWVGWFGYLNWVLFVANLIPALPLDGGRFFRAVMARRSQDGMIGPWTARACAFLLALIGLVRMVYLQKSGGGELIALALVLEWMVRIEARALDEGGFFDDGVFGYDFSQGYTSLEAGSPKVRPYRESALKRWRRRRSELRRQRREAAEAADEQRMDAILEKLHREGRSALSDEEHRFLIRVSARYRKRVQGS